MTAAAALVVIPALARLRAQDAAPNRREFTITARDFKFNPARLQVTKDDLVKLTLTSEDVPYGFAIDQYRIAKRIPAGGSVTLEFRAEYSGEFEYYSNMKSDPRHGQMKGQLVVQGK